MSDVEIRVIDNDVSSIGAALEEQLALSDAADIAVAFARRSGLEELRALPAFQQRGGKLRFLAGTDFLQTEMALFDSLPTGPDTEIRLSVAGSTRHGRRAFHPKLYVCRGRGRVAALIGSANFTRGGMRTNVETAVVLSGDPAAPALQQAAGAFARYWTSPLSLPLTESLRNAYATLRALRFEAMETALRDEDVTEAAARLQAAVANLLVPPASLSTAGGSTWLLVTSRENFRLCVTGGIWGAEKSTTIEKMKVGDRVIFYIRGLQAIGAAGLVTGRLYADSNPYWPDGAYPYRLAVQILLRPDLPVEFKPILPRLVGFPKGKSWGTALQTSQKRLEPKDAEVLWEVARKAAEPVLGRGLRRLVAEPERPYRE